MRLRISSVLAVIVILLTFSAPISAQGDPALETRTREIAAQFQCPVCQNLSVADSNAQLAADMRQVIKRRLQAGESEAQIRAYIVSVYGEGILLDPPKRGFTVLVWAQPILVVLVGLMVVGLALSRWIRSKPALPLSEATESDLRLYDSVLKEELQRYRGAAE